MIIDYHCCSVLDLLYRWYFTIVIRIMSQLMSPYSCYNLPPLHPKGCCQSVSSKLSRFPLCSSRAWLLLWLVPVRWLKMFWVPGMGTRLSRFGVFCWCICLFYKSNLDHPIYQFGSMSKSCWFYFGTESCSLLLMAHVFGADSPSAPGTPTVIRTVFVAFHISFVPWRLRSGVFFS